MKSILLACLTLCLLALASCTSANENQLLGVVEKLYGGHAGFLKGRSVSADPDKPQGRYLQLTLSDVQLAGTYGTDLEVPASNCLYLLYHQLTANERQEFDYLSVKLEEGGKAYTLSARMQQLAVAEQGAGHLQRIMAALQRHDYSYVAARVNRAKLVTANPDSIAAGLAAASQRLAPLATYQVLGYARVEGDTPKQVNLRFYVSVPSPTLRHVLWMTIDPRLGPNDQFLQGLHFFPGQPLQ